MSKEILNGCDFTIDFKEREIYELYKNEILKEIRNRVGDFVTEEYVKVRFGGECLSYEQNNKLYSSMKLKFEVKTLGTIWKEFVLLITPFNCYFYRLQDGLNEKKDRHSELTTMHRLNMITNYGDNWKAACKKYINEVEDFKIDLEKSLYEYKVRIIKNNSEQDMNIVEL